MEEYWSITQVPCSALEEKLIPNVYIYMYLNYDFFITEQ